MAILRTRTLTGESRAQENPHRSRVVQEAAEALRPALETLMQRVDQVASDHRNDLRSLRRANARGG